MTDYRTDATGRPLADSGRPVYQTEIRPERSSNGLALIVVLALAIVGALYFVFAGSPATTDPAAPAAIESTTPDPVAPAPTTTPDTMTPDSGASTVTPDAVTPEVTEPAPTPAPEAATPTPPATNP